VDFLRTYVGDLSQGCLSLALSCVFFLALETLAPREGVRISNASRLKSVVFWIVNGAIITLMAYAIMLVWRPLGVKPLLPSLAPAGLPAPLGALIGVVAAAFVGDFFYYWCHRAQHRFPWRFHAVHHSVRELSGIAGYHHFTEGLIEFALYTVPLGLFTDSPYSVPILGMLLAWQGNYEHSPTRLNFGPLGRYLVDNRFHRIHHSVEARHFDKNFGIFTTLWDSIFGTAYFPAPDEWPQTGVAEVPEPETVAAFLASPFVRRAKPAAAERPAAQGGWG
jgi:sterol desaturase/sphingolipid hydroxylase (fatty acid hydroxylase superfamily)